MDLLILLLIKTMRGFSSAIIFLKANSPAIPKLVFSAICEIMIKMKLELEFKLLIQDKLKVPVSNSFLFSNIIIKPIVLGK